MEHTGKTFCKEEHRPQHRQFEIAVAIPVLAACIPSLIERWMLKRRVA